MLNRYDSSIKCGTFNQKDNHLDGPLKIDIISLKLLFYYIWLVFDRYNVSFSIYSVALQDLLSECKCDHHYGGYFLFAKLPELSERVFLFLDTSYVLQCRSVSL